jgi:hypothetical protein
MDIPTPHSDGELNDLERRLAVWQPATDGLDADAALFAAGRASVRPGASRFAWPALAGAMTLVAAVCASWLAVERTERLALAGQLQQRKVGPAPSPALPEPADSEPEQPLTLAQPAACSYLASHLLLQQDSDAWSDPITRRANPPRPGAPQAPVFQVWQRQGLPDL